VSTVTHRRGGGTVPLYNCSLDSIGLKKIENIGGNVVRLLGSGGIGMGRNPDHDGTTMVNPVLAAGNETRCRDG
jgi:hypothetical protein